MEIEKFKQKLLRINESQIREAEEVRKTQTHRGAYDSIWRVDTTALYSWMGKVKSFAFQLGIAARPWEETLLSNDSKENSWDNYCD